eukprot:Plantae.Rhodophyta-Hildenbrandia_rubra.ctg24790.p1 GENE.Plantae.Rhodophyta-Hildenbrandia_rubra.ctg24790~~Plantae.Rhodophyta-Hildenbrandia_rubra.ctg24790.p1  ORF type:complete len:276 (+),score=65.93 Plantae.Rhodophyta-Hildenbrandia_rubra.ctg24790:1430-2257(+)
MPKRKRVTFEEPKEASIASSWKQGRSYRGKVQDAEYIENEPPDNSLANDPTVKPETVTAFNMTDELEGGTLDKDGDNGFLSSQLAREVPPSPQGSSSDENGWRGRDEDNSDEEEDDDWLKGVQAAATYEENKAGESRKRMRTGRFTTSEQVFSVEELYFRLWKMLRSNENPLVALRRMKKEKELEQLDALTEICDEMMGKGILKVYDMTKEEVGEILNWELKWGGDEKVHGPFSTKAMSQWGSAGYFAKGAKPAHVKPVSGGKKWSNAALLFSST